MKLMYKMVLCQQPSNKFEICPPKFGHLASPCMSFAHFLLRNNELCRPNCPCYHSRGISISLTHFAFMGSFFCLASLYLNFHLSLSFSLYIYIPPSPSFLFCIILSHLNFSMRTLRGFLCVLNQFVSARMFGIYYCFTHKFGDHGTLSCFMHKRQDFL